MNSMCTPRRRCKLLPLALPLPTPSRLVAPRLYRLGRRIHRTFRRPLAASPPERAFRASPVPLPRPLRAALTLQSPKQHPHRGTLRSTTHPQRARHFKRHPHFHRKSRSSFPLAARLSSLRRHNGGRPLPSHHRTQRQHPVQQASAVRPSAHHRSLRLALGLVTRRSRRRRRSRWAGASAALAGAAAVAAARRCRRWEASAVRRLAALAGAAAVAAARRCHRWEASAVRRLPAVARRTLR